ncbi:hypothetical protein [Brevundimonas sp. FT23042]|uniref:hypothetical protein n=1 Tax=Brevundimonas sp. FT23042 TaxID=3393749 RepID=UPI003B58A861
MAAFADIVLLLGQVFGLAAAPAAITGFFMRAGGTPPRGFARAFKLAYAPWLLTMAVFAGFQWYWTAILNYPVGDAPLVVTLALLGIGAYGSVYFVRLADRKA